MNALRRAAPLAVLAAVATVAAGAPATAKRADTAAPAIKQVTVTPAPVELKAKKSGRTEFTVSARVSDPGAVDRVAVGLYDDGDDEGRLAKLRRISGTAQNGVWSAQVNLPNNAERGTWAVRAFATDLASNTSEPDTVYGTFSVHHKTRIRDLNAAPEPVVAGEDLVVTGVLERYRPGKGWQEYGKRSVVLEFREDGTKGFKPVEKGRTDDDGDIRFEKVQAKETGRWRVTFAGNSGYTREASDSDKVNLSAGS